MQKTYIAAEGFENAAHCSLPLINFYKEFVLESKSDGLLRYLVKIEFEYPKNNEEKNTLKHLGKALSKRERAVPHYRSLHSYPVLL